jgi:isoleucyl-tRNA synthetase
MKEVQLFAEANGQQMIQDMEREGVTKVPTSIGEMILELEDVEIIPVDIPGWKVVNHGNLTVALDVTITEELRAEGIAREVVNRIQNIRKERNLEVVDRIQVSLTANSLWSDAINQNSQYIRAQVLADSLTLVENFQDGEQVEWEENQTMFIQISKS